MVAAMTTEPGIVCALGGAFVSIWPAGGEPEVIDGNVEMPGRGQPAERFGAGLREMRRPTGAGMTLYAGHGSVATPGAFAALGHRPRAARRGAVARRAGAERPPPRGRLPHRWRGGELPRDHGDTVFGWDEHTAPAGAPAGRVAAARRATRRNPDLADTLEQIGEEGAPAALHRRPGRADRGRQRRPRRAGHGSRPRGIPGGGPQRRCGCGWATGTSPPTRRRRWVGRCSR